MRYLCPGGIGDVTWALHKLQSVAAKIGDGRIDVCLSGGSSQLETRAMDFVRRFSFVDSVEMRPYSIHPKIAVAPTGEYNYIEDGMYNFPDKTGWKMERVCALMPNGPLERGIRLENWLPQYEINWDIWKDFPLESNIVLKSGEDYAIFYLGPLQGNTTDGHNRGPLWRPDDWIELGRRVHNEFGIHIVAVGAPYDAAYFDRMVGPQLNGDSPYWTNLIGQTDISQLYRLTMNARFLISYQSGVGIVSAYLGTPTAIWWRPRGDSISPSKYLSFDEQMASAWASPAMLQSKQYFPMVYKRHGIDEIMEWARCVV